MNEHWLAWLNLCGAVSSVDCVWRLRWLDDQQPRCIHAMQPSAWPCSDAHHKSSHRMLIQISVFQQTLQQPHVSPKDSLPKCTTRAPDPSAEFDESEVSELLQLDFGRGRLHNCRLSGRPSCKMLHGVPLLWCFAVTNERKNATLLTRRLKSLCKFCPFVEDQHFHLNRGACARKRRRVANVFLLKTSHVVVLLTGAAVYRGRWRERCLWEFYSFQQVLDVHGVDANDNIWEARQLGPMIEHRRFRH